MCYNLCISICSPFLISRWVPSDSGNSYQADLIINEQRLINQNQQPECISHQPDTYKDTVYLFTSLTGLITKMIVKISFLTIVLIVRIFIWIFLISDCDISLGNRVSNDPIYLGILATAVFKTRRVGNPSLESSFFSASLPNSYFFTPKGHKIPWQDVLIKCRNRQ